MKPEQTSADRVYHAVRDMAVAFAFKPSERIVEGALASDLGTSRTPLREALNRLAAEGFLTFQPGQGFFCRSLGPDDILDLYEARLAVECEGARLAAIRTDGAGITALRTFLQETEHQYRDGTPVEVLLDLDERFHVQVIRLSGNSELERMLMNLNARLRFVRWIDMEDWRGVTPGHHTGIVEALATGDPEASQQAMREHITRRREQATAAVQKAFAKLYVPG